MQLGGSLLAEILHDIGTTQVFDAMTHPALIPTGQVSRRMEHEIRGPFGLLSRSSRVQPGVQVFRERLNGLHEFTENSTGSRRALEHPRVVGARAGRQRRSRGIVPVLKTDAAIVQLLVQPPSSVDADANGEGESRFARGHNRDPIRGCWK